MSYLKRDEKVYLCAAAYVKENSDVSLKNWKYYFKLIWAVAFLHFGYRHNSICK
jgi:hypothetical protein